MECGAHAVLQGGDFFGYFEQICYLGSFNGSGSQNLSLPNTNETSNYSLRIMKDNAKLYIDGYFDTELNVFYDGLTTSCGVEEIILRNHP